MIIKNYFRSFAIFALLFILGAGTSFSQKFPAPRAEKLLNEMNLLIWSDPGADKVSIKLRIHRGSAFDHQGKEGTMALLGQILFPNESSEEFFREDLGGSLEVISNYDYLQINATAAPDKLLDALQAIANAILNPQITKETTAAVREIQLAKVSEVEKDPAYIADLAVAERLLGDFPYGRSQAGTVESLNKIDFTDLLFAKEKFLTSDNATIAISGNLKSDLVYRAARRYFGGWVKADTNIPATFRIPEKPDEKLQILDAKRENTSELRFAMRGIARSDKNYYAAEIVKAILEKRLQKLERGKISVSGAGHLLAGPVIFRLQDWNPGMIRREGNAISLPVGLNETVSRLFAEAITNQEFTAAKTEMLKRFNAAALSDLWLDIETYRLSTFAKDYQSAQNVSAADVKEVFDKFKTEPVASVLLFQNPKPTANPEN